MLLLLGDDEGLEQLLPDMFRDSAAVADRAARRVHPSPARGRAGARPRIDGASEIPRTAANSTLALCGLLPWRSTWLLALPAARLVPPPHDVGGGRRLARGLAEAPGRASAPRCVHLPGTPGLLAYASAWQLASILQKLIWDRVGAGGPAAARCGCPTRAARPGRRRRRSAGRRGTAPRPGSTAPPRPEGAARRGRRRRATGRSGRRRRRTAGSHPQRRRTITARLPAVARRSRRSSRPTGSSVSRSPWSSTASWCSARGSRPRPATQFHRPDPARAVAADARSIDERAPPRRARQSP